MASHGPDGAAARDRSPRGRSHDSRGSASGKSSTSLSTRSVSASRVRARSVPAASSPTAHRPGVDLRPFASGSQAPAAQQQTGPQYYNVGTPPQQGPVPTLPQLLPVNPGSLDDNTVNLFRQMMQAQDEQIRAQAAQVQQLTNLVKDLAVLGVQNASQTATSAAGTAAASSSGDTSGPAPMDVDRGIRSRRAENYIPTLPQLNFASMNTRHAEIRVWSAYKEELTSWLCLLDDRFAEELDESEQSAVPVQQSTLDVGKAARSSKLWFLLRQSLSKFQRAQDLIHLIEVAQKGASAGYEFWRLLNRELSVRSRVEGQALREQVINLHPPKHLKRPLDVMRWYMTELMKFESQVAKKYPELKVHEQEAVLGVLKYLDEDAKRYLLLHQTTSGLDAMLKGLQFYDEQLRVLTFQKEHHHGYLNAFGAGKGDKSDKGKGDKGKTGKGDKGKGKGDKGKGKGERSGKANKGNEKDKSGKGSSARAKSKAKKTDVCHHCGKKGHWVRDCWLRQAAAVSPYEANATITTGTAGSSGSTTAGSASAATKAAPKPPGSQPTTKGDVGKGAEKGVRTFLEGAYFAMPMVAPSFIESGDKIFWLLDSGSSYHVVSRATLESGHVKVLSREKKPKTVCQTATGDLVEVGSDTHATIEVNFLTTRPIEKRGGVLSTFACTCRLEAVVSDEIKHNLINLNLLCWKGWRPTLYEGLLTAEQRGITLYPHLYGDCTWLESVVPEHPSAMLASVSSHVGRSVGWSGDFSAHEKQHEFSRHEHEFSHEQHAVGQSSCDSSGVQLVGRLPARVVELLQSSTVGKPCQDRRLCQDHVGTPLSSGPTTSSGLGPTLGAQGSLRGSVSESEFLQRSACVHGLVGRLCGRAVAIAGWSSGRKHAAECRGTVAIEGPSWGIWGRSSE